MPYIVSIVLCLIFSVIAAEAQNDYESLYAEFRQNAIADYYTFRDSCNHKYAEFLRTSWDWFEGKAPLPCPKDNKPVPPRPFDGNEKGRDSAVVVTPVIIDPIAPGPQPKPVEPIYENQHRSSDFFTFDFYGRQCRIRLPETAKTALKDCSTDAIADGWEHLSEDAMDNAVRDCLETRIRYNLCDWAYLNMLSTLGNKFCTNHNSAVMLTAFLYCQSGYQMRLGVDSDKLVLLYGSKHQIYDRRYFDIDGTFLYPFEKTSESISICNATFEGETPLSLFIDKEQLLGTELSADRAIKSEKYADLKANSKVPQRLIEFYNAYPTSAIDDNPMTRWAMYANTPLAESTRDCLYPSLKESIRNLSKKEAAEKLLNWVQTGFVYEYDNKVWGHDRAFFAEETLYYPYCDCEDRSILFSRLVRDLLKLDVALVYYPGHLATAVHFKDEVKGDYITIGNRKYTICDPTYIGAPVGAQMPELEYDKTQAIVLR